jgi:hypothetical protein
LLDAPAGILLCKFDNPALDIDEILFIERPRIVRAAQVDGHILARVGQILERPIQPPFTRLNE